PPSIIQQIHQCFWLFSSIQENLTFDAKKMNLEEEGWVSVPYDGILEVEDIGDEIFSTKYVKCPTNFYEPNHFNTSQTSQNYVEDEPLVEKEFDHKEEIKEIIKNPNLITKLEETSFYHEPNPNKDPIFQVFLKKENQFVEMTMGFPVLSYQEFGPCTEICSFQCEEKKDDHVVNCSSSSNMINKEVVAWKESNQRLNFWKLGVNGIGVFCSLGMAAATIYIITCGNGRHKQQNQKLKFQIHPHNKKIKQVVPNENEAMSAVKEIALVNAKITNGGHSESL
ncbi:hypothetical protein R6Q57_017016, partial [Mikania cordata]